MKSESRKTIQIVLTVAIIAAAVRVGIIFNERREANRQPEAPKEQAINPDYYVVPKRLHAYDLTSARQLTQQPVWVKEGYRYRYYPYDPTHGRALLGKETGTLPPIEKLQITDVRMQATPGEPKLKQMLAIFRQGAQDYAVPIGAEQGGSYQINADEMFFYNDPHELYKHWPKEIWDSIEKHEAKPGMNEIQTSFALGMGVPQPSSGAEKTVQYPDGGEPVTVTFRNGKAAQITPGKGFGLNR
jgi:hypothetical protein